MGGGRLRQRSQSRDRRSRSRSRSKSRSAAGGERCVLLLGLLDTKPFAPDEGVGILRGVLSPSYSTSPILWC